MIHKEQEYIPKDATDDSHQALRIGNPANRIVHFTIAIGRSSERHTSSEFTRSRKQRIAGEFKFVMHECLQSISHTLVLKQAATDRSQVKNRNVVAMAPLRARRTECVTIARPQKDCTMKFRADATIVGEDGVHCKFLHPTIGAPANYLHASGQPKQIRLN